MLSNRLIAFVNLMNLVRWLVQMQVSLRTDYVPKGHDGMCRNKDEGLCSKLKVLKLRLKMWNKEVIGHVTVRRELALKQVGF